MTTRAIVIADYDPEWPRRFERERDLILDVCGSGPFAGIEHIGSTAVPGLAAKPIIDMMPGIRSLDLAPPLVAPLASIGYVYVPEFERPNELGEGMPERRYFRKDAGGTRAVHLHVVEQGSAFRERHLLFRDYLRRHPDAVREYAALKRRLADDYNRTMLAQGIDVNLGYTDHKTEFITGIEAKARAEVAAR